MAGPAALDSMSPSRPDNGAYWPVGVHELLAFRDSLCGRWSTIAAGYPDRTLALAADSCIAHLLVDAMRLFENGLASIRAAASGRAAEIAGVSTLAAAMVAGGDLPRFPREPSSLISASIPRRPLSRLVRERLGALVRREVLPVRHPSQVRLGERAVAVSRGTFISHHARQLPRLPVFCEPNDFLAMAWPLDTTPDNGLTDAMVEAAALSAAEADCPWPAAWIADMRRRIAAMTGGMAGYLRAAEAGRIPVPRVLWGNSALTYNFRVISTLVRAAGGTVIAHDHGTGEGWGDALADTSFELAYCDRFITFAEGQAEGYRNNPNRLPLPRAARCEVLTVKGDAVPTRRPRRTVKRVLVLGSFYRREWITMKPLPMAPLYGDWHLRLIRQLEEWGFSVTIRPHPEEKRIPEALIPYLDRHPGLGEALEEADCVVMDYPQSTSFRNALQFGVPIVLVDFGVYSLSPAALALATNRMTLVPGAFAADNRLDCAWDQLRRAVTDTPERDDTGFFEAYFS